MTNDNKIQKIETEIDKINHHLAQCRMDDQKADHDKLIHTENSIKVNSKAIIDLKNENKEQHHEMITARAALADKLEQVSGNLNQSMIYIKDLQNGAKIRVGLTTTIISGIIATTVAAGIIYVGTLILGRNEPTQHVKDSQTLLLEISKQIKQNSEELHKFEQTIQKDGKSRE